ncbi:unnamed protein product [Chondrus crispus]|uniref:Uncharacterized protein n=1 Tax=Chondrus crispus TaxID=2769 RepID=S0F3T5_CHOCR|nr:unnamed protein product [Chondrus crispus]CDF77393.1 unnamed protein product [Chondrus crispus]|eukprot:XP_005712267.1 unnamed protein product [Chondrus crispus]
MCRGGRISRLHCERLIQMLTAGPCYGELLRVGHDSK